MRLRLFGIASIAAITIALAAGPANAGGETALAKWVPWLVRLASNAGGETALAKRVPWLVRLGITSVRFTGITSVRSTAVLAEDMPSLAARDALKSLKIRRNPLDFSDLERTPRLVTRMEPRATFEVLNGNLKIGRLGRVGPLEIKGGEIGVYKWGGIGAAGAYCNTTCLKNVLKDVLNTAPAQPASQ
jgi:hypothetical protein